MPRSKTIKSRLRPSAEAGRNFGNKLWNATRFVLMNIDGYEPGPCERSELADRWIWSRLQVAVREMTEAMQSYRFSDLTRAIYDFVWRDYCDWYLELAKVRLQGGDPQARRAAQEHLVRVLETALRLLHPLCLLSPRPCGRLCPTARRLIASWSRIGRSAMPH